ncbi:1-acyl-sn-glycerol-3-phosphate acyltransferase [Seleniivibrio woodruffii]|uniref:lysophospholipid acyltransferase family protein n=1 Tax=Seleniivibrio woodruffii TaxID=1078050 RepID=UPI0026EDAF18|nr:lysophospholipid acyltransferase family protein [Seleniivibrio woodruffii]
MKAIYSLFVWITFGLTTAFLTVCGVPFVIVGKNPFFYLARLWAKISSKLFLVRYEVQGLEKIEPDKNYVFMGNHQSYVDIFSMISIIDKDFLFMAKRELFSIPFFGYAIKHMGLIPIDRGESRESLKSLFDAAKKIQEGYSVLLFPEGTRSEDGVMLPFKRGAFTLAVRTGQQIIPFVIDGSGKVMKKGAFIINPFRKVRICFLDPVSPDGIKDREMVDIIRARMEDAQKELSGAGTGK